MNPYIFLNEKIITEKQQPPKGKE